MLATILKSRVAREVSIQVMDAFVAMRKYISSGLIEQKYINNIIDKIFLDMIRRFDFREVVFDE